MRPQQVSVTGVATSNWIPVDRVQKPTGISLVADITGTVTSTIEFTTDDIFDASVTPLAMPVTGMAAITADTQGNIAFPVQAIRVNNTAGAGTVRLTILQTS